MSDLDHTDALAAEYVLGTLDAGERAQARALLSTDPGFATKVELWERRLGELHLMVEPVEPDSGIWVRIRAKIPESQPKPSVQSPEPQMPTALSPAPQMPTALHTAAQPPSLEAIEARISETATALASAATPPSSSAPTPAPNVTPAPLSDEVLPSISDATPMPASEAAPAPILDASPASPRDTTTQVSGDAVAAPIPDAVATTTWETAAPPSLAEPVSSPPVTPPPAPAAVPVQAPDVTPTAGSAREVVIVRRGLRRWRALAVLMMLVIAAVAALVAAWRFAPDRVPPTLQPAELMRHLNVTAPASAPPRRPARTESLFEE